MKMRIALVGLLVAALHYTCSAATGSPDLPNIVKSIGLYWQNIPPLKFDYAYTSTGTSPGANYKSEATATINGPKIAINGNVLECRGMEGLPDKSFFFSFDGQERSSIFQSDCLKQSLDFGKLGGEAQSIMLEYPLTRPLSPLLEESGDPAVFYQSIFWINLSKKIGTVENSIWKSKPCFKITYSPDQERLFSIYVDQQTFFPIAYTMVDKQINLELNVLKVLSVTGLNGTSILIPTKIERVTHWPPNGKLLSTTETWNINEKSIVLNVNSPKEVFTPTMTRVKRIYDMDVGDYIK